MMVMGPYLRVIPRRSFVARETTVLAEYTPYSGEQLTVARSTWVQLPCRSRLSLKHAPLSIAHIDCFAGNFNLVALECLQRITNPEPTFTIACDRHTFNFLVTGGFSECRWGSHGCLWAGMRSGLHACTWVLGKEAHAPRPDLT